MLTSRPGRGAALPTRRPCTARAPGRPGLIFDLIRTAPRLHRRAARIVAQLVDAFEERRLEMGLSVAEMARQAHLSKRRRSRRRPPAVLLGSDADLRDVRAVVPGATHAGRRPVRPTGAGRARLATPGVPEPRPAPHGRHRDVRRDVLRALPGGVHGGRHGHRERGRGEDVTGIELPQLGGTGGPCRAVAARCTGNRESTPGRPGGLAVHGVFPRYRVSPLPKVWLVVPGLIPPPFRR